MRTKHKIKQNEKKNPLNYRIQCAERIHSAELFQISESRYFSWTCCQFETCNHRQVCAAHHQCIMHIMLHTSIGRQSLYASLNMGNAK